MSDPTTSASEPSSESRPAEPADYRFFMERQWADLHHSRIQEWSALGVVTGAHVAIVGFLSYASDADLSLSIGTLRTGGAVAGVFFAAVGALVTCRHRALMQTKLTWISAGEYKLGLVKDDQNPRGVIPAEDQAKFVSNPRGLAWPRRFSTSWLILMFYILCGICDLVGVAVALGITG